ncbi:MAG TPA: penicillin-binding protein 2 [Candidatus Saccharimonadales bacterium]|nr:penicillin-binding protein 2 [Candidatus Saccharimonadales bacterium]
MDSTSPRSAGGPNRINTRRRLLWFYTAVMLVIVIIITRLFYLQIVKHDHYQKAALNDQLRQYTIAPDRGIIKAYESGKVVPIVLNEKRYTLYADPTLVRDPAGSADKLAQIVHASGSQFESLMRKKNTRYVVLAKRLSRQEDQQITNLKLPGVGLQAQDYRTYPQGDMAAQVLGFVNDAGHGAYGIEQQFDKQLSGKPGKLKAITDASGVPLAANRDNIQIDPTSGDDITLTLDVAMQQKLETILQKGLKDAHAKSGTALIMDPNSGTIKAVANYPTFNPATYYNVSDLSTFSDEAVSKAVEVGSIMKTLSISAGLNQGVITPNTAYHDPGYITVDGATIKNVEAIPEDPVSIKDVLKFSLNTGAVHVFKLLGGGQFNLQGRNIWHDYMTNHFQLGKTTGIKLPNESPGFVPSPNKGYALDLKYANTAFGQGMTATMLQMASAVSSVINGGTYYKPHIVSSVTAPNGRADQTKTEIVKRHVVSAKTSSEMRGLMKYVYDQNYNIYSSRLHPGYLVGGKTGTAQVANPAGGYYTNKFNGTFVGFVGGDQPQYVIVVLVDTPDLPVYQTGGADAAAPIFGQAVDMLINDFNVVPISR